MLADKPCPSIVARVPWFGVRSELLAPADNPLASYDTNVKERLPINIERIEAQREDYETDSARTQVRWERRCVYRAFELNHFRPREPRGSEYAAISTE